MEDEQVNRRQDIRNVIAPSGEMNSLGDRELLGATAKPIVPIGRFRRSASRAAEAASTIQAIVRRAIPLPFVRPACRRRLIARRPGGRPRRDKSAGATGSLRQANSIGNHHDFVCLQANSLVGKLGNSLAHGDMPVSQSTHESFERSAPVAMRLRHAQAGDDARDTGAPSRECAEHIGVPKKGLNDVGTVHLATSAAVAKVRAVRSPGPRALK